MNLKPSTLRPFLILIFMITPSWLTIANAESLFQASTSYSVQQALQPRSLFTPPIAREVGDLVTITINETTNQTDSTELKVNRAQTINDNGTSMFNSMVQFVLNKLPFNTSKLQNTLAAPSFNGLNNANNLDSKASVTRQVTYQDAITCQVVQVLPNGDLMVQGQKTLTASKDRSDMIVTGIVKPYYLDQNNQIASTQVANFQMTQDGKGVISRQQSDGIASKIYQFFN